MSNTVRTAHLLIKHEGSRNPVSRRTNQSTKHVKKADAIAELKQWADRVAKGELTFEDAARQRSDCGSFANGGDLDFFSRGDMQKPFEDAAFALAVGATRLGSFILLALECSSSNVLFN